MFSCTFESLQGDTQHHMATDPESVDAWINCLFKSPINGTGTVKDEARGTTVTFAVGLTPEQVKAHVNGLDR